MNDGPTCPVAQREPAAAYVVVTRGGVVGSEVGHSRALIYSPEAVLFLASSLVVVGARESRTLRTSAREGASPSLTKLMVATVLP